MSEPNEISPSDPPPLQSDGWLRGLDLEQQTECIEVIAQGATPGLAYYVLLILSTLIAGYGLLANSTATVIGAMLVAPLMGPILGLAMGTVLGDTKMFRHSLLAEISGVVLVVLTGAMVALIAGVDHIDFLASEIANRTRPTLYDMAIGLAAGLAGAFCLIQPGLRSSVAGVAIAVALVPPLTVTGITSAGWLHGYVPARDAFGSFMLFLANFLTIEMAAGILFYLAGFRTRRLESGGRFRWAIVVQVVLLLSTAAFLSGQLRILVRERIVSALSRQALQSSLRDIPGADLDDLVAQIRDDTVQVRAVVGSRTEIIPEQVASMQNRVSEALSSRFPNLEVRLVVRTVSSTFASATGFLFEPQDVPPSPEQIRSQLLEQNLRALLTKYPGVELSGFRPIRVEELGDSEPAEEVTGKVWPLEVTLRSPYDFHPRLVTELENRLSGALVASEAFDGAPVRLLVRTVPVATANAGGMVTIAPPGSETVVENRLLNQLLTTALEPLQQQAVLVTSRPLEPTSPDQEHYLARLRLRGPALLDEANAQRLRQQVEQAYEVQTGRQLALQLEIDSELARQLSVTAEPTATPPTTVETWLPRLVPLAARIGGRVEASSLKVETRPTAVSLEAVVLTPKPLTHSQVVAWQRELKSTQPQLKTLRLRVDNRQGQILTVER
jgi:uncharacterized hydrophobic protein (TIGR00271 family)